MRKLLIVTVLLATSPLHWLQMGAVLAAGEPDAALQWAPDVVRGRLDNGLSWSIEPTSNPPGRIRMRLVIRVGSLDETDNQRGLTHFLQHMAFDGSEHFAPGDLERFFEKTGLEYDRDALGKSSYDHTRYTLDLPVTEPGAIETGMTFFADVLGALTLPEEWIQRERRMILEERRAQLGSGQRLRDRVLPRIAPGARIGERPPLGEEETIRKFTRRDLVEFQSTWYTPGNAALIITGDVNPPQLTAMIERLFGSLASGKAPPKRLARAIPLQQPIAVVATDPDFPAGYVECAAVGPPLGPSLRVSDFRASLARRLAIRAFNHRLRSSVAQDQAPFREGGGFSQDLFGVMRYSTLYAIGEPAQWRSILTGVIAEQQRVERFGFTTRELELARRAVLAQSTQNADAATDLDSDHAMRLLTRAVLVGEPRLSASQRLQLTQRLAPTITPEEAQRVFLDMFSVSHAAFVVLAPDDANAPSEQATLDAARLAMARPVQPPIQSERAVSLPPAPKPGAVDEMTIDRDTAVFSAWLSNGVRMHHRRMPRPPHRVTLTLTLAGGRIEETSATRGLTAAAAIAFSRPSTKKLSSVDISDLLIGLDLGIASEVEDDAVVIRLSGAVGDLPTGLRVLHLLLTEPFIESAALRNWAQKMSQRITHRRTQPVMALDDLLAEQLYSDTEARLMPMQRRDVDAIDLASAQRWLEKLVNKASIEVAVVGDINRSDALDLISRSVGSLASRDRIGPSTLSELRRLERKPPPHKAQETAPTHTPVAAVLVAFPAPDPIDLNQTRLMRLATSVLETRLTRELRDERGLIYEFQLNLQQPPARPGAGLVRFTAPVDVGKADLLANAVEKAFERFAETGPDEREMAIAKRRLARRIDQRMQSQQWWSRRLATQTYRGRSPSEMLDNAEAYDAYSPSDVQSAMRRWRQQAEVIRIVVKPESTDEHDPVDQDRND